MEDRTELFAAIDASRMTEADKALLRDVIRVTDGGGTMREAREHAGLSVGQAAKMLGTKTSTLRAVESGSASPSPMMRVMMLALYDVDGFSDA